MFAIHEDSWHSVNDELYFEDLFTYKKIKTNKQITYYNDVLAFDIEASSFIDANVGIERDTSVYDYLTGTKIHVDSHIKAEIPDLNDVRRALFGRLFFTTSGGQNIDRLYNELMAEFPYYFPELYAAGDQLKRIIEVYTSQSPERKNDDQKRACMYIWQLAINGKVIIGRTWDEFVRLMDQISEQFGLSPDRRMIVYVHNLSYEFEWIKDLFTWEKVFAVSARKPIYAVTSTGIEFRCSFMLSQLSLAKLGDTLTKYKVSKKVGDLDYEKIRHSKTPLTKKEMQYCINDVLVVSAFVKESMEKENDDITRLPLTYTGYCRRYMKQQCLGRGNKNNNDKWHDYHNMIKYLTIADLDEWDQLHRGFMGGFTVANPWHSHKNVYNASSEDLASAYPAVMCYEPRFPMSKGKVVVIKTYEEMYHYLDLYCCIFDVRFKGLMPKFTDTNYISLSKCLDRDHKHFTDKTIEKYGVVLNNGRVVGCDDWLETTITEIDFELIEKLYTWKEIEVGTFRIYKRGYLPKSIIEGILNLYKDKVSLKGVDDDLYRRQKGLLNSCYGMICQRIIQPVNTYDNKIGWTIEEKEGAKLLKKYNNSKNRILYYPWSLYVTALVRRTIVESILVLGDDFVYADTDSLKYVHGEKWKWYFDEYNEMIREKMKLVCQHYDLDPNLFEPATKKGKKKLLGVFENETVDGCWKILKANGAKRYLYMEHDGTLVLTVSGVNKKAALPYIIKKYGKYGAFKAFNDDLVIPGDHTGKLTHYYLDEPISGIVTDYLGNTVSYESKSGVYMEKASYSFSIEASYLNYLNTLQGEEPYEVL